jgi:organic radical activating enzyme
MKIIKIHNPKAEKYKFIEWKLHNVCNYSCSFCGPNSNSGSENWLPTEFYLDRIDKFIDEAESEDKKIWFTLTGGEPTLMPNFEQIPMHIKKRGHHVQIMTNGSRTLRWWKEFAGKVSPDVIIIAIHTHQQDNAEHIGKVTELFKNSPTDIAVIVTAPSSSFDESFKNFNYLVENAIGIVALRRIFIIRDKLKDDYSDVQLETLKKFASVRSNRIAEKTQEPPVIPLKKVNVIFDDGHEEINSAQHYLSREMYNFFGWKCTAGQDYIRIEHTKIYRGNCQQDGVIGDLTNENFGFADKPTICTKKNCVCAPEWCQPKFKL